MPRIAIIGTGLIGTSIALRLARSRIAADLEIIGCDRLRDHAQDAERTKAFTRVVRDPREAVHDAPLVVVSTPTLAVRDVFETVADALAPGATVTDTASTKAEVLGWAARLLPSHVSFVGGHPMAGRTESGPKAADAALFEGARWVIAPPRHTDPAAVDLVTGLAYEMGATPMPMDAHEHDAYVAAISHVPMVIASALFRLARTSEAWPELSALAAGGFRDTTRVAGTNETMAHDIIETNREQILHWLDRFSSELGSVRALIADPARADEMFRYLQQVSFDHDAFMRGSVGRTEIDANLPVFDFTMSDMLFGGALAERGRQMMRQMEDRANDPRRAERRER